MKRSYDLKINRLPLHQLSIKVLPPLSSPFTLPTTVDLRDKLPPVWDQGNLGSCTAFAICAAYQFDSPTFSGSKLFQYYNERLLEGTVKTDSGATVADGITCLKVYGLCPETDWPYIIAKFAQKPTANCYTDALKHKAVTVHNINNDLTSMKNALSSGIPFVVGIAVYSSFETVSVAKTGVVPMPTRNDRLLGGHCVLVCGYIETRKLFICRNSWGSQWGDRGYFYLPYLYLLDSHLCGDLWTVNTVKDLN
jgi:C1A family cysteine protease